MSCAVCGRASRGFGFTPMAFGQREGLLSTCSMLCLDTVAREGREMFKLNHFENQAIDAASDAAGEYLEALGKTDLVVMTAEEWRLLIETVFVRATATIQKLSAEGAVPF